MAADTTHRADAGLLLEHATGQDVRALLDRAADALGPFLEAAGPPVPPPLVDAVAAEGGPRLEALLDARTGTPAVRARLARSGSPQVAAFALRSARWTLPELRTLLAAADPADERWTARTGAVEHLLHDRAKRTAYPPALRAAVVSPFPRLVRHALEQDVTGQELTRAEKLRALLSLLTHGGPGELAAVLAQPALRGALGDAAEQGAAALRDPSGAARLRAAVEDAEGTAGAVEELYHCATAARARTGLSLRDTLDWPALHRAHTDRPFPPHAVEALAAREDCPRWLLPVWCAAHPRPEQLLAHRTAPVPADFLDALPPTASSPALLAAVVRTSLGRTVEGPALLRARPASAVLQAVRGPALPGSPEEAARAEFRAALCALLAERFGDRVAPWRVLRRRLSRFRGSVADLLDDAVARAAKGEGEGPWPEPAERPAFTETPVPKGTRAAFLTVLDSADPEVQWRLLGHTDGLTAYELLVLGTWRPRWLELALADPDPRPRGLLARRPGLPAEAVTALAGLDDPAVNAGLVHQRHATWEQRLALVTGAPFTPGRAGRLPVDAEAAAALAGNGRRDKKVWLAPWAAAGDPAMTAAVLGSVQMSAQHLQWRMLLGRWERRGPEGLKEEIPYWFADKVRTTVLDLLADPDWDAALARLRELVKDAGSTRQLARRIRQSGGDPVERLLAEGYELDWAELLAEHQRSPLTQDRLAELARMDGCPWLLREGVARMTRAEQRALGRLERGEPAAKVLGSVALSAPGDGVPWVAPAVRRGLLDPGDLLRHGRPARFALGPALAGPSGEQARRELAALIHEHLSGRPDAWTLALRLYPQFSGTAPELLRTVARALAPV
ncbi:hypothetical protein GCM10027168_25480 [Streptomyces capparidis]